MADNMDSFVFYASFLEAIELMPAEEQLEAYKAITYYGINGEDIKLSSLAAKMVFTMAKPQIDANKKRRKDGNKGGRPSSKPMDIDADNQSKPMDKRDKNVEKPVETVDGNPSKPLDNIESDKAKPAATEKETAGYEDVKPVVIEDENQWLENKKPNVNVNVNVNGNGNGNVNDNGNVNANEDHKTGADAPVTVARLLKDYAAGDGALCDALAEFKKMRERMKKPMTAKAAELMLSKLDTLSGGDKEQKILLLNQSIENGWAGVFELKNKEHGKPKPQVTANNFTHQKRDYSSLEE